MLYTYYKLGAERHSLNGRLRSRRWRVFVDHLRNLEPREKQGSSSAVLYSSRHTKHFGVTYFVKSSSPLRLARKLQVHHLRKY